MLVYYSGISKEGNRFHRLDDFVDVADVYDMVEHNDEELIQLVPLPHIVSVLKLAQPKKLKDKEVVEFCQLLATYLDGGVEMLKIFQEIQLEPGSRAMHKVAHKISAKLNEGHSLSSAFRTCRALPDIVNTLVEIGEKSGNISQALKDAAAYLQRSIELRSATYRAMIYPAFTLSIMLIGLVYWIVFVIPQVVKVIQMMDVELPVQTRILLRVAEFLQQYWWLELTLLILMVAAIFIGRQISYTRYYLDKAMWYMPLVGKVIVSSQMAFYFNHFKVLYNVGVPVSEILQKLQQSVPNRFFQKRIILCNKAIKEGDALQSGYEKAGLFESIAMRIIGVGEQTGNLDKQLDLLGKAYLKRVQVFVETLPKILEPVFILIVALVFILFASTLLGPLYQVVLKIGSFA